MLVLLDAARGKSGELKSSLPYYQDASVLLFIILFPGIDKLPCLSIVGAPSHIHLTDNSTIARLILRFYDPIAGAVRVDGKTLSEINLEWWRQQVGYVAQVSTRSSTSRDRV